MKLTRRELLISLPALVGFQALSETRFAVITDLHHGLAPDSLGRLRSFVGAVRASPKVDAVLQLGDFCYSTAESQPCLDLFGTLPHKKVQVLGNHDMDKVDKATVMRLWGMKSRYGAQNVGGYRVIHLDLNHFKRGSELVPYSKGNYFASGVTHNWADPEQLDWLRQELLRGTKPTILLSHQPLGFAEPGRPMPPEQLEVLKVVSECRTENRKGAVVCCLFGHLHVDRLEYFEGIPCLCINSASYFWSDGMVPYTHPLYAFLEFRADGALKVIGISGEFKKTPPSASDAVVGRSGSISTRFL